MCFEHRREKRARGRTRFISQSFGLFYTRESGIWSFSESGKYPFKFLGAGHFLKSRPLFFYINAGFCDETLKFTSRLEGRTGGPLLSLPLFIFLLSLSSSLPVSPYSVRPLRLRLLPPVPAPTTNTVQIFEACLGYIEIWDIGPFYYWDMRYLR